MCVRRFPGIDSAKWNQRSIRLIRCPTQRKSAGLYVAHMCTQTNKSSPRGKQPDQTRSPVCSFVKIDAHSRVCAHLPPAHFLLRATSPYLVLGSLLLFLLMLVNRHLQKVLFTADEAHRAAHPSEARARTSKPIQKLPALGALLCLTPVITTSFRLNAPRIDAVCAASLCAVWGGLEKFRGVCPTCAD